MSFLQTFAKQSLLSRQFFRMGSTLQTVVSANAPPAAAAYSHAVKVNGFIYLSGQIPYTPEGKPVEGTIKDRADQVIKNALGILKDSNSSLEKIVKVNVFLTDMNDFADFNSVYVKYFNKDSHLPARSCVAVKALPLGVDVEMEVVAVEN